LDFKGKGKIDIDDFLNSKVIYRLPMTKDVINYLYNLYIGIKIIFIRLHYFQVNEWIVYWNIY
jgi:hypothetical protein